MLNSIFATKLGMTQVWTAHGKRLPVTRCRAGANAVVTVKSVQAFNRTSTARTPKQVMIAELGYGTKKLKNMSKPLRAQLKKGGFSSGVSQIKGVRLAADAADDAATLSAGDSVSGLDVLSVGDVVMVRGKSKGKGFAGAMKRHNFAGGPKTHGQSDRARAVGSIGAGTTPGRVWKGKKMPGHMGDEFVSVKNMVVVHIDPAQNEIWLSGPLPGARNAQLLITKTGRTKSIELNHQASNITSTPTEAVSEEADDQGEEPAVVPSEDTTESQS